MPLQWRNQFWQSLEEGAGKQCSECGFSPPHLHMQPALQCSGFRRSPHGLGSVGQESRGAPSDTATLQGSDPTLQESGPTLQGSGLQGSGPTLQGSGPTLQGSDPHCRGQVPHCRAAFPLTPALPVFAGWRVVGCAGCDSGSVPGVKLVRRRWGIDCGWQCPAIRQDRVGARLESATRTWFQTPSLHCA